MTQQPYDRVFNFSAGPAVLPVPVLEEVRDELLNYDGTGHSLMEMSHRAPQFVDLLHDAENSVRSLLGVSDDYAVLFLQGGAALQFSMIPANLLRGRGGSADYIISGSWGKKALKEAKKEGNIRTVWDGSETNYDRLPSATEAMVADDAAYLYYCSNETIQGVQFATEPPCPDTVPLVCDSSSDILSRPLDINQYGLLYACAQKNAGPAGVTLVVIRKDLLPLGSEDLPGYLLYRNHEAADSEWNTPPTFAIYCLGKVARWLQQEKGGLEKMAAENQQKAGALYDAVDQSGGFYSGHAAQDCRSMMNVTFRLPSDELQSSFLSQAAEYGLCNLKGHRSVGGIRASVYNAMPLEGAMSLASFMRDFATSNG